MVRTRFFTSSAVFTTVRATGLRDLLRWISGPELSMSGPHMNLIHVSPCCDRGWWLLFTRAQRSVPRCTSDRRGWLSLIIVAFTIARVLTCPALPRAVHISSHWCVDRAGISRCRLWLCVCGGVCSLAFWIGSQTPLLRTAVHALTLRCHRTDTTLTCRSHSGPSVSLCAPQPHAHAIYGTRE